MKFKQWLFEATKQQFIDLAHLQRDEPEHAMLKVQHATQGSIINPVVEHVGDIIHRMTEEPTFSSAGYEFVKPKVERCLRYLKNSYGFSREFFDSLENNAKYLKVDPREFKSKVFKALDNYADEHAKLPTYNRAQKLAQMAAVSLGRLKFNTTIQCLEMLNTHLINREEWVRFAHQGLTKNESFNEADQNFRYFGYYFPSINKVLKVAKKYTPESITPKEEMMGSFVETDKDYAMKTDLSKPVIFATLLVEGKQYSMLIDGHHRLYKAIHTNEPLLAITLNLKDTLSVMQQDYVTAKMRQEAKKLKLI